MKLLGLKIEGLRKIRAAELDFDGKHLVEVRGRNGAGKSTVIDSILWLFRGSKDIPADVVTHGMDKGVIVGQLDGYTIRRTIKPDGTSTLAVEGEGGKVPKPQEFLDKISGQFLDPEWFAGLPSAEKRKIIMKYAGIDFTAIDVKIANAEQNRLIIGRELKALGALPPEPEKAEEVSIAGLLAELNRLNEYNKKQDEKQADRERAFREMVEAMKDLLDGQSTMESVKEAIETGLPDLYEDSACILSNIGIPAYIPTDEAQADIANSETINAKARAYAAYQEKKKAIEAKKSEYDAADANVEALRKEKIELVKNAKFPIKGLEITDEGLSFQGITDNNWSDSESLKIAIKIAAAWSGELKAVYIKRGEAFDAESLSKIRQYAEAMDLQVIVEIVDDSYAKEGDGVVYIEDGGIVSAKE